MRHYPSPWRMMSNADVLARLFDIKQRAALDTPTAGFRLPPRRWLMADMVSLPGDRIGLQRSKRKAAAAPTYTPAYTSASGKGAPIGSKPIGEPGWALRPAPTVARHRVTFQNQKITPRSPGKIESEEHRE